MCDPFLEAICNQSDIEVLIVMMESLCKVCTHIMTSSLLHLVVYRPTGDELFQCGAV